jgi:hypothetical protein
LSLHGDEAVHEPQQKPHGDNCDDDGGKRHIVFSNQNRGLASHSGHGLEVASARVALPSCFWHWFLLDNCMRQTHMRLSTCVRRSLRFVPRIGRPRGTHVKLTHLIVGVIGRGAVSLFFKFKYFKCSWRMAELQCSRRRVEEINFTQSRECRGQNPPPARRPYGF